jgi:hypothetical protein
MLEILTGDVIFSRKSRKHTAGLIPCNHRLAAIDGREEVGTIEIVSGVPGRAICAGLGQWQRPP